MERENGERGNRGGKEEQSKTGARAVEIVWQWKEKQETKKSNKNILFLSQSHRKCCLKRQGVSKEFRKIQVTKLG